MVELEIRQNTRTSATHCAICDASMKPIAGPEMFLARTWRPVCLSCGRRYDPQLAAELERRQAEHLHQFNPLGA